MGCGRSKFHARDDADLHSKSNGIEKEIKQSTVDSDLENAKFRTRRCTPAVNTNGNVQQSKLNAQEKTFEKFSLNKPTGNKAITPQVLRVTNSQLEFFKMLDEKIEQGGVYSSDEEDIKSLHRKSTGNIPANS